MVQAERCPFMQRAEAPDHRLLKLRSSTIAGLDPFDSGAGGEERRLPASRGSAWSSSTCRMYRQQAADCRKQADAPITPPDVRAHWLRLAEQYDDLADQALALSSAKNEPLSD
jgi:hypothetical protein